MSVTRLKQGCEEGEVNPSTVYKTIEKQGLEEGMGHCTNAPKTIGKTYFEEGEVATCAHQWKTDDIHKRKK